MQTPTLFVTPAGRILRHRRAAGLIAQMEAMKVSLRDPLRTSCNVKGR